MDVAFIDTPEGLDGWQSGRTPALLAMDTEFVRERTYFAQLGLVQVAAGDAIALVDPLPDGNPIAQRFRHGIGVRLVDRSIEHDLGKHPRRCGCVEQAIFGHCG